MKHYIALVHKDADSAYGIQFPDIPGVFSASDDAHDIVKNAIEALQLYAEDETLPDPSSHADIVARDDVRAALAEGGHLVSVPFS
ncbi:type II toxin-antitoxin system HicB family antitoxin [Brucella sp. RRSP16]|uniref:type II toxin-antitoxin system HicB family antitoxin n=1 Tax=Brucella sp. RRSP16 TaxID=3453707 RepID=UPI003FCD6FEA